MKNFLYLAVLTLCAQPVLSVAGPEITVTASTQPAGGLSESMKREVDAAETRALDWLAANQKEDGSWSNGAFPALTALPASAFLAARPPLKKQVIDKALAYIAGCAHEDGSIYMQVEGRKGGGLSNYNTAICMTVLHESNRPEFTPLVQKARQFVAQGQHMGDDNYKGGFGYDRVTERAYTDLLNTYYSVEAMRRTQSVEDQRPRNEKRVDIDWAATIKYVESLQNQDESGAENAGGFIYNPTDPKAGTVTNRENVVYFRSYGSITYAGLLSLIYAQIPRNDPRVLSALDWTARHWSLEENPGMGPEGLFFFYSVLTKALSAAERDFIPLQDGTQLDWRSALAAKLVALQKIDPATGRGYWVNESGRYWENDPVLVTSYALAALQMLR
jgi:squalene-hopene/tetraprenyl-beta-curcumene cyclase